jgi:hypothetical protein
MQPGQNYFPPVSFIGGNYHGEWHSGRKEGRGEQTHRNGDFYCGEFVGGMPVPSLKPMRASA